MNANIIKQDSLLSNISNISVKIDHNQKDGSGLFNNFIRSNSNEVQIPIDALIISKPKTYLQSQEPENTWVVGNNAPGLSEEEDDESDQDEPQSQPQKQQAILADDKLLQVKRKEPVESEQNKRLKQLIEKRLKNETKNIPKNYGKAIISFIEKYEDKVRQVTEKSGVDYDDFIEELKERKKVINTIADLRSMWVDYRYAKCIRLLRSAIMEVISSTGIDFVMLQKSLSLSSISKTIEVENQWQKFDKGFD